MTASCSKGKALGRQELTTKPYSFSRDADLKIAHYVAPSAASCAPFSSKGK
jgi:hypothetical protein